MNFLDTEYKKKSAIITSIILLLMILCVFNLGMKYLDPPVEYGLAINFGNSEVGSGEPVEKTKEASVKEEKAEEIEEMEEQVEELVEEAIQEDVVTDDSVDEAPVVEKTKDVKEPVEEAPKEVKPKEKPKPKPSKATTDALNSLLNGTSSDGGSKGEGDDKVEGVKGDENGDPNSNKYYGNSGTGSGGNYNLAGRKALSKPILKPDCEEEGVVVVSIEVDKNGNVIKADPGKKGSTNTAECLKAAAKKAALQTKWNADGGAPTKQKGSIKYKFSLSK